MGHNKIAGVLLRIPIYLGSKTGMLPRINFFSVPGLAKAITGSNFKIIDQETGGVPLVAEVYLAGKKTSF